eukprot:TRINITY_DN13556_c0_g1_i2.p1 TRINITY_DN13556_c0_g1~~TRINITY_DN13556_c0_g1_i2.p1  ORF type:complete len:1474 (+),score=319.90 TRINITY_DN13556_c0_g1_i2:309-4424(+)
MRAGSPSLGLSLDLRVKEESERNRHALRELEPWLLVVDDAGAPLAAAIEASCPTVPLERLLSWAQPEFAPAMRVGVEPRSADDALYYLYTGGSTGASKCVVVTHRMALHEIAAYPAVVPMDDSHRLLQQSSVYWGATALGFFDIAWAFGACLVVARDAKTPEQLAACVRRHGITAVGVVPSVLEALEPADMPSLRVALTWGEALSQRTIDRWCPHATLLDLLIASEYWLSFVADHSQRPAGGGRAPFRPVPGVSLTLRDPDTGNLLSLAAATADPDFVGELLLAGPMLTAVGYADAKRNVGCFETLAEGPGQAPRLHYRTRDLVSLRADGSLQYRGRADGYAKVGGRWVDVSEVEANLRDAGCSEAAIVWHSDLHLRQGAVAISSAAAAAAGASAAAGGCAAGGAGASGRGCGPPSGRSWSAWTNGLRRKLPGDSRLDVFSSLPRHPATGKVHRAELARGLLESGPPATPAAGRQVGLFGLALAAAVLGGDSAALLPAMWALAPCRSCKYGSPANAHFQKQLGRWIAWQRAVASQLSASALRALPWVALALMDHEALGLRVLDVLSQSPLGHLGTALFICRRFPTTWCPIFAVLGARRCAAAAAAAGGGAARSGGWPWLFWMGLPGWADEWASSGSWQRLSTWAAQEKGRTASFALLSMKGLDIAGNKDLRCCSYCWCWASEGGQWRNRFYCGECWEGWRSGNDSAAGTTPRSEGGGGGVAGGEPGANGSAAAEPNGATTTPAAAAAAAAAKEAAAEEDSVAAPPPEKQQKLWRPGVDRIVASDSQLSMAAALAARAASAASPSAPGSGGGEKSKVEAVVERCTGLSGLAEPLGGLESLKVLALLNALRRELKIALSVREVGACETVGDLVEFCRATATRDAASAPAAAGAGAGGEAAAAAAGGGGLATPGAEEGETASIYVIPRFFQAPVSWLLRLDVAPDEACLRIAARQLLERHVALRMVPKEADGIVCFANNAAPWFAALREALGPPFAPFLARVGRRCHDAWPRVRVRDVPELSPAELEAHFEWCWFDRLEDLFAEAKMRRRSRGFNGPIQLTMLSLRARSQTTGGAPLPGAGNASAGPQHYLCLAANHAAVDGACMMPLIHDLTAFHAAALEVARASGGKAGRGTPELPALASPIAMLSRRLRAALSGEGEDAVDFAQGSFSVRSEGYDHFVVLELSASRLLDLACHSIGVPMDHLILSCIVCAYARISGLTEVRVTAIVPMRDGLGESNMVGNIASTRCVHVPLGHRSLVGVALEVSRRLRLRLWSATPVPDDENGVFLNVRSCPSFPGATVVADQIDMEMARTNYVGCALGMYVDQDEERGWILSAGLRSDLDGSAFGDAMRSVLYGLALDPCAEALPARAHG